MFLSQINNLSILVILDRAGECALVKLLAGFVVCYLYGGRYVSQFLVKFYLNGFGHCIGINLDGDFADAFDVALRSGGGESSS